MAINLKGDGKFLDRIKEVLGEETQVGLAAKLGIRQSSISDAVRRGNCPPAWLLQLVIWHKINPTWVLTGEGPQYLAPSTDGWRLADVMPAHVLAARQTEDLINDLARRHPGCAVCIAPLPRDMREGDLIGLHVVRTSGALEVQDPALAAAGGE